VKKIKSITISDLAMSASAKLLRAPDNTFCRDDRRSVRALIIQGNADSQ
jgi:hypothetical protein